MSINLDSVGEPPDIRRRFINVRRNLQRVRAHVGTVRVIPYIVGTGSRRAGNFFKGGPSRA